MKKFLEKSKLFWKNEYKETRLLLHSIPAVVVTLFAISVVIMNLAANKTIVSLYTDTGDQWFALDGGILVSWLSFMCMDIITKRFGPKASTKISILAMFINLLCCGIFFILSIIPTVEDYSAFNGIFGGTWFILLGSTIAFLISAIINNVSNWGLGKLFKKNPDGKLAYVTRTYVSTFVGQFFDNLIFSIIVFMLFAPIFWDGFCWSFLACVTCSLTGAVAELLMEIFFSPLGYKICMRWKRENVGQAYIDYISTENPKEIN